MVMNDKNVKEKEDDALLRFRRDAGKTNKHVGSVRFNNNASGQNSQTASVQKPDIIETEIVGELKIQLKDAREAQLKLKDEVDRLNDLVKAVKN